MNKLEVSRILEEIGTLLELKGENPFKFRAYHNAAVSVEALEEDLDKAIEDGVLADQKGIGKGIYEKIVELNKSGHLKYYEELKKEVPAGLLEIIKIPGVGPKKAKALYDELGISTVGELEYACMENRLIGLHGFGEATQERILHGIEYYKKGMGHHLFNVALKDAEGLLARLEKNKSVLKCSIAGSIRRRKEVIKDIDIVVSSQHEKAVAVMDYFTTLPDVQSIVAKGDTKSSVILNSGINADLRIVSESEYPFALHYFTGSAEHNTAMRSRAKKSGLKLNEYGLFKGDKSLHCKSEEDIFRALGLSYIEPELREDKGEIEAAEAGTLPELVKHSDIKGIFHVHTTYSDASMTLHEVVTLAQKAGYHYIGISDHSKSAYYAGGLTEEKLSAQHDEIDSLNSRLKGFYIFKGIECDILADGSLDYSDKILEKFDFVIASVHSRFNMDEDEMTERIIRAISNPYTTMLGHPTGRLLLSREGYKVDLYKVIDAAAEKGVVIEINAHPYRFDLDWRYCRYAKERGVKVSINPDAHHAEDLANISYGVGIARKGWLTRNDVLNTMTLGEIRNKFRGHHT
ncbi:MAG: DNA polymerase/3'-5' exonuclease PolX [Nitrospirae bacterium]|nr:DNA polymerase/3'-5' exonuclease PolX [Nitrospirota bacterium]